MSSPISIFLSPEKGRSEFDTEKSSGVGNDQDTKLPKVDGSYGELLNFPNSVVELKTQFGLDSSFGASTLSLYFE